MKVRHAFEEATEALRIPRLVRLAPNLYGASFTLMKLIPATHILRLARQSGELTDKTVVVETTSGTFGLALAMQTALSGHQLVLVSDPAIDDRLHRRLLDLGARVERVAAAADVGGYQAARLEVVDRIRARLPDTFCPEQYTNPENPRSYAAVAAALVEALGQVDCLVGAVGSGGSMCGTVGFLRSVSPSCTAIGVDTHHSVLFGQPDGARALRGLGNSLLPANLDHSLFDEVHWCTAAEAYLATRELHRNHALFHGPTSGAAYLVARWWARRNPDALTVVMLPDEGHRYLDTAYDDSWLEETGALGRALPAEPEPTADPRVPAGHWTSFAWARRTRAEVVATGGGA